MKKRKIRFKRFFVLMLCGYSLIPLAFLMMTFADFNVSGIRRLAAYAVGAVFWTGALLGTVFLIVLDRARKCDKRSRSIKGMPGLISFFRTRQGKLADIIMIPVLSAATGASLTGAFIQPVRFALWAAAQFLIILHSALNGKNYIYMKG
ncbi:MAG: hypothetical protein GXY08_07910 [Ruminococcus sp.]|nr:hypothetical protein [Ruminococcus sp.]